MQDKLNLKGMKFYGFHGNLPEEKRLGQWFEVDVELTIDLSAAGASDQLGDSLNYVAVYKMVKMIMEGPSVNLIEALAARINYCCLQFDRVQKARVAARKPQVPLGGPLDYVEAAVERSREDQRAPGSGEKGGQAGAGESGD